MFLAPVQPAIIMCSTKRLFSSYIDHFIEVICDKPLEGRMFKLRTILRMKILIAAATAEEISILKEIDTADMNDF